MFLKTSILMLVEGIIFVKSVIHNRYNSMIIRIISKIFFQLKLCQKKKQKYIKKNLIIDAAGDKIIFKIIDDSKNYTNE